LGLFEAPTVVNDALITLVSIMLLALSAVAIVTGPRRPLNRALAAYFTIFALTGGLWNLSIDFLPRTPTLVYNRTLYFFVSTAGFTCYLLFAARALDTPASRVLRNRAITGFLILATLALLVVPFLAPSLFVSSFETPAGDYDAGWTPLAHNTNLVWLILAYGGATALGIDALVRAPSSSPARSRVRTYVTAFAFIDVTLLLGNLPVLAAIFPTWFVAGGVGIGLFLLARAVFLQQLFDFDLKIKWTLQRGTVAAIILGAAIVVGQIAQNYLSGAFGWLAGGVAAGALLFAIRPIEHFAARLSDRAMPKTTGSADYIAFRKLEVYRAAVESEIETHGHDHQEHAVLERLRVKLGISREDADALQREARERVAEASA
jgi:hypothetical protein